MISIQQKHISTSFEVTSFLRTMHEKISSDSPFTSLLWQESWALSLEHLPHLYTFVKHGNEIGYFWLARQKASPFPFIHTRYLNQTGIPKQDQVWIEHNDIMCTKEDRTDCLNALFNFLDNLVTDKLYVSMALEDKWKQESSSTCRKYHSIPIKGYRTYLAGENLEGCFSKNTREQTRRSNRLLLETCGDLSIKEASKDEARDYFNLLGQYHVKRWGQTPEGSGFNNPFFLAHHTHLINYFFDDVSLVKVTAGNTVLGYSYNIAFKDNIYFYCSGINYAFQNKKIKPGYSMHFLLMQFYRNKGFQWYDFLGGESQYKKSLSSEIYEFSNLTFYPASLLGNANYLMQMLKDKLAQ